jgi:hypothetical protein
MLAGFARTNTTKVNLADTKFPSDQTVERGEVHAVMLA